MELSITSYAVVTSLVFAVSFVFAMLGLGGGMLYVPIFKWMQLPLKNVAIPLGLLLNGLTTLIAMFRYAREGLVDFRGGAPAAIAALLLAPLGAWCVQFVSRELLLALFAAAVAIAGLRMLYLSGELEPGEKMPPCRRAFIGTSVGGFAGFVAGLLGIGGGFIVAPMLMAMGYPTKEAAGTTAFIATFSSFSGFLGHMLQGRVDPWLVGLTTGAVLAGASLGSWFMAKKARPGRVKKLYGIVLLAVAAKLLHGLMTD